MNSKSVTVSRCGPVDNEIRPPGSKSITNRALVCAALAEGESLLHGALDSDDTRVMLQAWQSLGLELSADEGLRDLRVQGCGGKCPTQAADIFVGNSGTTIRFLAAALSTLNGRFTLDGVPRMRERPIGDLVHGLEQLGASIVPLNVNAPECPPLRIDASGLAGGTAEVRGNISSQFLSGMMLASPLATQDVQLRVVGELVSVPYVSMTAHVMRAFDATVEVDLPQISISSTKHYSGAEYHIEPDASAASYFWAVPAIVGGRTRVLGLSLGSLQGDVGFCRVLEQMGCEVQYEQDSISVSRGERLVGVDVDMSDISDTVQTLAAVALFADGPTSIHGVAHNRVKETDRIGDLACELRKLGATVEEREDGFTLIPPSKILPAEIETYQDHRMAMSLALVGLRADGVEIMNPGCTAKTYPGFWDDLATFTGGSVCFRD